MKEEMSEDKVMEIVRTVEKSEWLYDQEQDCYSYSKNPLVMIRGHASAQFHFAFDYVVMYDNKMISLIKLGDTDILTFQKDI
jgi:hypothetical protein